MTYVSSNHHHDVATVDRAATKGVLRARNTQIAPFERGVICGMFASIPGENGTISSRVGGEFVRRSLGFRSSPDRRIGGRGALRGRLSAAPIKAGL
jgi:hypothetical protein